VSRSSASSISCQPSMNHLYHSKNLHVWHNIIIIHLLQQMETFCQSFSSISQEIWDSCTARFSSYSWIWQKNTTRSHSNKAGKPIDIEMSPVLFNLRSFFTRSLLLQVSSAECSHYRYLTAEPCSETSLWCTY
jgi:hypothetical protein